MSIVLWALAADKWADNLMPRERVTVVLNLENLLRGKK
jgi:hypothetical protein